MFWSQGMRTGLWLARSTNAIHTRRRRTGRSTTSRVRAALAAHAPATAPALVERATTVLQTPYPRDAQRGG